MSDTETIARKVKKLTISQLQQERDALAAALNKIHYLTSVVISDIWGDCEDPVPKCVTDLNKALDLMEEETGEAAILRDHDEQVRRRTLETEWRYDWPAIFSAIADQEDDELSSGALEVKRAILEAIEKSKWLAEHDAALALYQKGKDEVPRA